MKSAHPCFRFITIAILFVVCLIWHSPLASTVNAASAEWFVAPDGDDAADGSLSRPFATVQRAQQSALPGDTVYLRGGTYKMQESQIAKQEGIFAYITVLDKSGTQGSPITYTAYQDEKPVFDCADVKPANHRVDAFLVSGSWLHLQGIEVTGVQVTITDHTQSICFEVNGSNNILERLSMHDGQAIGVYLTGNASNNLVLNCDAWSNWDYTSGNKKGGNVDGFGSHGNGAGNVFRGCRAWYNSDDGFDCINANQPVVFENCWAFYNGRNAAGDSLGDGNGFKAGGYGVSDSKMPTPIPRNTVRRCIAVGNKAHGFYANHHPGGSDWFNNSAYRNGSANYNFLGYEPDSDETVAGTSVPGTGHIIRNNLSHGTTAAKAVIQLADTGNTADHNAFPPGKILADSDFESIDETQLRLLRRADGSLPDITFLKPKSKSGGPLIDAGVDVGLPYAGVAPDIGAIEIIKPVITSTSAATATQGAAFTYAIIALNTPATYNAAGLPVGLSIDTATGLISGSPAASGTYTITLSASNAAGTATATLTLAINTQTALVTLAGFAQNSGTTNGRTTIARFHSPNALTGHADGNLYIADTGNNAIRAIDPLGNVTMLSINGAALALPSAIISGRGSTLIVADTGNDAIRSLNLATSQLTTLATQITRPGGLARDTAGNLYIASTPRHAILKLVAGSTTATILAGTLDAPGADNGDRATARLNTPTGLALSPDGQLYVADTLNNAIRRIDPTTGSITTIAGQSGPATSGTADGDALTAARFNRPEGIAIDIAGNLYIADTGNHVIRHLDLITGEVTTSAGLAASAGTSDGLGANARLNNPAALAVDDATGDIYVADTGNHTIRVFLDSPRILKHPETQSVTTGVAANFNVLAIGAPNPGYQWHKNGDPIVGATDHTYEIANAQAMHAGGYSVLVSNEMGTVASHTATLTVTATASGTNSGTAPPPSGGGGSSNGGGGASSLWYAPAIALLTALRAAPPRVQLTRP